MVLLFYRIKANIPVILMGETGCGKTALIIKLNQILNNGKATVEKINIDQGITEKKLWELMENIDNKVKKEKDEVLWVFFDKMNTCLIGACNPYRERKENKEKYEINISENNDKDLVYLIYPLPQSLLYYVFNFGRIGDNDEKIYIYNYFQKMKNIYMK